MKITVTANQEGIRLETENDEDVFSLGQLAAKLRDARHDRSGGRHTLHVSLHTFLRLALEACKP